MKYAKEREVMFYGAAAVWLVLAVQFNAGLDGSEVFTTAVFCLLFLSGWWKGLIPSVGTFVMVQLLLGDSTVSDYAITVPLLGVLVLCQWYEATYHPAS